ncbi:hypothetical protein CLF_113372 [Clonorchis sinensis]|uniref:Pol-related protein n=1 Tax=Clonorchis sinensis TaxID=79923 RepID=G7YYA8_CLOSI|nr:hypothetical protein CLF_113372 [Clonorchis sinensis]
MSFTEKSAQKAFAVLRMIRRTFSRITHINFQILYWAYVRLLPEHTNPVVYSGRTKDVILIERVQRAAKKMVAGLKSVDYETRLVVLDLFPMEYRRLQRTTAAERQEQNRPGKLGRKPRSCVSTVNP